MKQGERAKPGPRVRPIEARFWPKVDRRGDDECWPWLGFCWPSGYGCFYTTRLVQKYAHRIAYELRYGEIPAGMVIMHRCDNPPCCNPSHLRMGTVGDNNRDRSNKGRGRENRQWGADNPNAKLREDDVKAIIAALQTGETQQSIADRFGVQQPQVSRIANRKTWAYLWES